MVLRPLGILGLFAKLTGLDAGFGLIVPDAGHLIKYIQRNGRRLVSRISSGSVNAANI
jgi:hypothetical protein